MKIINKIIILLFKKIIKKNKFVKNGIIAYLKDEHYEELEEIVHFKEEEESKKHIEEAKEKERRKNFIDVKAGDIIIAKSLNPGEKDEDNHHLYRPFFIVGRSTKNLFGIYCTSVPYNGKQYFSVTFNGSSKVSYLDCSKIISISIDKFKFPSIYTVYSCDAKGIIKKVLNYSHNYNQIDFKTFFNKITFDSIVLYNNKYYKIASITKNGYIAYPLQKIENYNNVYKYAIILGKRYIINESRKCVLEPNKITVITDEVDYHVYEYAGRLKQEMCFNGVGDKTVKKYSYGDVLSVKGSKNKIIYITSSNKKIYYVTYDDIDFFRGISSINKDDVIAKYSRLSDCEIEKLTNKISKYLGMESKQFTDKDLNKIVPVFTLGQK